MTVRKAIMPKRITPASKPAIVPGAIVLRLPLPPSRNTNSHGHWSNYHRARRSFYASCEWLRLRGELPKPPVKPFAKAYVTASIRAWNPMDDTNAAARLKLAEDWLVRAGYMADDSRKHLRWRGMPTQTVCRDEPATVTLTLQPVEDWEP